MATDDVGEGFDDFQECMKAHFYGHALERVSCEDDEREGWCAIVLHFENGAKFVVRAQEDCLFRTLKEKPQ